MRRTKIERQDVAVLESVWCDVCGKEILNPNGCGFEFASLHASWGYNSGHDMEQILVEICEHCTYEKFVPLLSEKVRARIEAGEEC